MTEALRFYHLLIWLHISLFSLGFSLFPPLKNEGIGLDILKICSNLNNSGLGSESKRHFHISP